jgi:hypothetical protein
VQTVMETIARSENVPPPQVQVGTTARVQYHGCESFWPPSVQGYGQMVEKDKQEKFVNMALPRGTIELQTHCPILRGEGSHVTMRHAHGVT